MVRVRSASLRLLLLMMRPGDASVERASAGSRASRGERERVRRSWREGVAPRSALLARQLGCADDQVVATVWQQKDEGSVSRVEVPLSRHLSDSARDAVRGGLDRIVGKMRIPGSGLDLSMSEQLSDHRQTFSDEQTATGKGMPQVMDAHVI